VAGTYNKGTQTKEIKQRVQNRQACDITPPSRKACPRANKSPTREGGRAGGGDGQVSRALLAG